MPPIGTRSARAELRPWPGAPRRTHRPARTPKEQGEIYRRRPPLSGPSGSRTSSARTSRRPRPSATRSASTASPTPISSAGPGASGKTSVARIFTPDVHLSLCAGADRGAVQRLRHLPGDLGRAVRTSSVIETRRRFSNNGVEGRARIGLSAECRPPAPAAPGSRSTTSTEVHMLSTRAFNALLKTLEGAAEPHVKFFLATTEPNKIPITVLLPMPSGTDFAGITPDQDRIDDARRDLRAREGVKADEDALQADRPAGLQVDAGRPISPGAASSPSAATSSRPSWSTSSSGIASDERTLDLLDALADRAAPRPCSTLIDQAVAGGCPAGRDAGAGALDFLRDAMVLAAGANASLRFAGATPPAAWPRIKAVVDRWPASTRSSPRMRDPGRGPDEAPWEPARATPRRSWPLVRVGPARVDDRAWPRSSARLASLEDRREDRPARPSPKKKKAASRCPSRAPDGADRDWLPASDVSRPRAGRRPGLRAGSRSPSGPAGRGGPRGSRPTSH